MLIFQIKNKLLIFGGRGNDKIQQYDISKNQWKTFKVEMPKHSMAFGCTSILDGRFVLLFGGQSVGYL